MLKREIKYEDYDGNQCVDIFYFNITRPEIVDLEVEHEEGLYEWFQKVVAAKDNKTILDLFKRIVLLAYGEKTDDGKRFIKTPEMKAEFAQTAAYAALFTELATDDKAAAEFMLGVLPRDMAIDAQKQLDAPPPAPAPTA